MTTHTVTSLSQLVALIERHAKHRAAKVHSACRKAANRGRAVVKKNVPVAFGEIRESAHTEGELIVVDAPHAAPVNNGSRPHWAPLAPLIAWVKLRGMQGLRSDRQISRLPGTTTARVAKGVAGMLRSREVRGPAGYMPIDAAEEVARAIQRSIAKKGTKPHHFMELSIPELRKILAEELRAALNEDPPTSGAAKK